MKYLVVITLSILFSAVSVQSQDMAMEAIKSDDGARLAEVISIEDIDACIDINGNLYTYLSMAIKLGSDEAVNFLIDSGANLDAVCRGKTPLMYAVKYGKMKYVKSLIEAGAKTEITNGTKTLMYYAKKYKQADIEEYLKTIVK